jgi:hypothetical protein
VHARAEADHPIAVRAGKVFCALQVELGQPRKIGVTQEQMSMVVYIGKLWPQVKRLHAEICMIQETYDNDISGEPKRSVPSSSTCTEGCWAIQAYFPITAPKLLPNDPSKHCDGVSATSAAVRAAFCPCVNACHGILH